MVIASSDTEDHEADCQCAVILGRGLLAHALHGDEVREERIVNPLLAGGRLLDNCVLHPRR